MEKYPVGTLGIGPGIDWVLTRTQAREQVCTMCPSRLSGRPSRSITSLQQGRSDRLSRRSSRSITSLQQGRSDRLSRSSSRSISALFLLPLYLLPCSVLLCSCPPLSYSLLSCSLSIPLPNLGVKGEGLEEVRMLAVRFFCTNRCHTCFSDSTCAI